jgi:hypothetical protein
MDIVEGQAQNLTLPTSILARTFRAAATATISFFVVDRHENLGSMFDSLG